MLQLTNKPPQTTILLMTYFQTIVTILATLYTYFNGYCKLKAILVLMDTHELKTCLPSSLNLYIRTYTIS